MGQMPPNIELLRLDYHVSAINAINEIDVAGCLLLRDPVSAALAVCPCLADTSHSVLNFMFLLDSACFSVHF
jgi:hypothetical protein